MATAVDVSEHTAVLVDDCEPVMMSVNVSGPVAVLSCWSCQLTRPFRLWAVLRRDLLKLCPSVADRPTQTEYLPTEAALFQSVGVEYLSHVKLRATEKPDGVPSGKLGAEQCTLRTCLPAGIPRCD